MKVANRGNRYYHGKTSFTLFTDIHTEDNQLPLGRRFYIFSKIIPLSDSLYHTECKSAFDSAFHN